MTLRASGLVSGAIMTCPLLPTRLVSYSLMAFPWQRRKSQRTWDDTHVRTASKTTLK
jgi:hypothetical protein